MEREMRIKDRLISREECEKALQEAEYGSLATISADGTPYITPLNFVYKDGALYFHCAKNAGHKMENIAANNKACFSVVEDPAEKRASIEALAEKLSPDFHEEGIKYINAAIDDISMLKFEIDHMTGKASK